MATEERPRTRVGAALSAFTLPASRRHRRALALLVAGGLVVRLAAAVITDATNPGRALTADSPTYLGPAVSLITNGHLNTTATSGQPIFFRTPGYPSFIGGIFWVLGQHTLAVILFQCVLNALMILVAYFIAARVWDEVVGLVAAGLIAFDPYQIRAAAWIQPESLTALLLLITVGIGYRLLGRPRLSPGLAALMGLALVAATMVRPSTYYFPVIVVIVMVVHCLPRITRRDLLAIGAFLLPFVLLVGAWQVRNHEQVDSWQFAGVEGPNTYYFRAAGTIAERDGISFPAARERLHRKHPDLPSAMTYAQWVPPDGSAIGPWFDRMNTVGRRVVIDNPIPGAVMTGHFLVTELTGWGGWEDRSSARIPDYFGLSPILPSAVVSVGLLAFYALAVLGFALSLRDRRYRSAHVLAFVLAGYVLLLAAGPEARYNGDRFRIPVIAILSLFAARAVVECVRRARSTRAEAPSEPMLVSH